MWRSSLRNHINDDSLTGLHSARRCVEVEGCEIVSASNGREALEVIAQNRPDVVLTGLHMPEMHGLELILRMKKLAPDIPVMLMTAHGSEEVAVLALKAGAAAYVPKRSLQTDLKYALRNVLSGLDAQKRRPLGEP